MNTHKPVHSFNQTQPQSSALSNKTMNTLTLIVTTCSFKQNPVYSYPSCSPTFVKLQWVTGLLFGPVCIIDQIFVLLHLTSFFKVEKAEFGLNHPTAKTPRLTWIIPYLNKEQHWHSELCSELHTPSGSEVGMCVFICMCVYAWRWYYQCHRLLCSHCYIYITPLLSLWPHTEWLPHVCVCSSASVCVCVCVFVCVCRAQSGPR